MRGAYDRGAKEGGTREQMKDKYPVSAIIVGILGLGIVEVALGFLSGDSIFFVGALFPVAISAWALTEAKNVGIFDE